MSAISIEHRPASTIARVMLDAGDELTTEAGTMVAMSANLSVQTSTHQRSKGGFFNALKRVIAGQSLFLNHYKAHHPSELILSHSLPGDMTVVEMNGESIIVQAGSFLACDSGVKVDVGWQGMKNFISGESLFWLKCSGTGKLVLSSYGAIVQGNPPPGYIVDTSHIVAFDDSLKFSISKAGNSWLHSFLGGEGFVCRFEGQGRLFCQSHSAPSFGYALSEYLKPIKRGGN